ncbi:ethylene-responsive transcription factor ERF026-like [Rutidosis leptorrhynchoides]|uniref:ethylene-responsive transcription factor ERF026-like n=1 Tax=Rutidosis leptorrhynchoides TaxID=125765 RepID=UPI003A99110D
MGSRRNRNSDTSQPPQDDPRPTRHPIYHGIRCRAGKWVSEIREPNKTSRIWLGTYPTPEMAAAAYDVAALALKGTYAVLNFPESVLSYTLPECPTADDIRAAASTAAAARAPTTNYQTVVGGESSNTVTEFGDDDVFGMPNMLSDMAEGMMISPPRIIDNSSNVGTTNHHHLGDAGGANLWDY